MTADVEASKCCWDDAQEELQRLKAEIIRLEMRQQELLLTIRRLSAEVPYEDERGQVATLIAEVGRLRAELAENKRDACVERREPALVTIATQREAIDLRMVAANEDMTNLRKQCEHTFVTCTDESDHRQEHYYRRFNCEDCGKLWYEDQ